MNSGFGKLRSFFVILVNRGSSAVIANSTIVNNTGDTHPNYEAINGGGIVMDSSQVTLINSIVFNNSPNSILIHESVAPSTFTTSYSNIENGESGIVNAFNGEVFWQDGNINGDPEFTDAQYGDYTLQTGSPCIDAGTADLDGDGVEDITDYYGTAPDMGAFEYSGSAGPTEITVTYNSGWNMVGLPIEADNSSYETLFPNAQSGTLYSFNGIYQLEETLEQGTGYLLRLTADDPITFTGTLIDEITISLSAGWNLFSGLSTSISSDVVYGNGIIQIGTIYECLCMV